MNEAYVPEESDDIDKDAGKLVQSYDSVEHTESHRAAQYYLPEEIAEDLGHPTTRKGWTFYWKDRLDKEIKDLSQKDYQSQAVLSEWIKGEANERINMGRYVEKRMQVMHTLASRLAEVDQRIDYPESEHQFRRVIHYNEESKEPYIMTKDGRMHLFDVDNITTDIDWGVVYRPDKDMPPELWRSIRKRMDIAEARRDIEEIFNEELAKTEGLSLPTTSITGAWLEQHFKADNPSIIGIIGERMAKNALHSLGHQHKEMELRVENSNAFEDAELKYDFKISLPNVTRGVATTHEGVDRASYVSAKRNVGVQFTISKNPEILSKKEGQLRTARTRIEDEEVNKYTKRPVSDIVLVSLRFDAARRYEQWLSEDKPPGGPEQYISEQEKSELLQKITKGLSAQMKGPESSQGGGH